MSEQEKNYYNIVNRSCGLIEHGECITLVATRFCTESEVKKEVKHLNKNVNEVDLDEETHGLCYFEFQKLEVTESGIYNSNFNFTSNNKKINESGLKGEIVSQFDDLYAVYINYRNQLKEQSLISWLLYNRNYKNFVNDKFTEEDVIKTINKCSKDGLIKTDTSDIDFYN